MTSNQPEEAKREKERQELWQRDLGMPAPEWLDESLAPPLTEHALERLREYAKDEIKDKSEYAQITSLTLRFRSWSDALLRIYEESRDRRG